MEALKEFFSSYNSLKLKIIGFIGTILLTIAWSGVISNTALIAVFGTLGASSITIFLFLMNEGMKNTRSISKYMLRLIIYCVICAFPYMMIYHNPFAENAQVKPSYFLSTAFTILFCVGGLFVADKLPNKPLKIIELFVLCLFGMFIGVEFAPISIILAFMIHYYDGPKQKKYRNFNITLFLITIFVVSVSFLAVGKMKMSQFDMLQLATMVGAILGIPFINRYNGKVTEKETPGSAKFTKWAGYFGYLSFLIIFAFIKYIISL